MKKQDDLETVSSENKPSYRELEERIAQLETELRDREKMEVVYKKILSKDSDVYNLTRAIIDNVPNLIWAKDLENRYILANQSSCDILLKCSSPLEVEGKNDMLFAHRERKNGHIHTFGEQCVTSDEIVKFSGKKKSFIESGIIRGKGLVLEVTKSPIFNRAGEIIGTVGCGQDVTKIRKMEAALKDTSRILRDVANDVESVAIHGYDEERRVTLWNHASESLYGYTQQEALGNKLEDLILPEGLKEKVIYLHHRWFSTGKKIPSGKVALRNKKGEVVHVYSSYILTKTYLGREMFCIDIDLSTLLKAEEDRRALREQLLQVQKMEAIGTLAGGIAHDFNNILTIILGSAELALDHDEMATEVKEYIGQILTAGNRAKELVNQILTFSRQTDVDKVPVLPETILDEVLSFLRSSFPRTIAIEQKIDMGCGPILVDPTQIHQLCMNLCTNAYHAMEDSGGTLSVTLERKTIDTYDQVEAMGVQSGNYVVLVFKDTGCGIEKANLDKIFNPYFTTKEAGKGTGMGLAIVHGIVKSYNGFVTCESEIGKGSEFRVHLPVIPGKDERDPPVLAEKKRDQQTVRGSERILLIDDEPMLATIQKNVLEMLGYKVVFHNSSTKAFEVFKEEPDAFDLVISDQAMPDMTGVEIAKKFLEIRVDLPVIILTGFSSKDAEELAYSTGVKAVARKPITIKDLAVLIRKVLRSCK
jgi:two-component system, sensor histidine kinase